VSGHRNCKTGSSGRPTPSTLSTARGASSIRTSGWPTESVVPADASRLTQLFENLFDNAVEHGETVTTVRVDALVSGDGFYVADDGVGIPSEDREWVFEHGTTSNENGTGFGLSMGSDIARAHGWTVSVTAGANGGARFVFETD